MTTRRKASSKKVEEEIANVGVPPQEKQAPSQEQDSQGNQALANPLSMTYG